MTGVPYLLDNAVVYQDEHRAAGGRSGRRGRFHGYQTESLTGEPLSTPEVVTPTDKPTFLDSVVVTFASTPLQVTNCWSSVQKKRRNLCSDDFDARRKQRRFYRSRRRCAMDVQLDCERCFSESRHPSSRWHAWRSRL